MTFKMSSCKLWLDGKNMKKKTTRCKTTITITVDLEPVPGSYTCPVDRRWYYRRPRANGPSAHHNYYYYCVLLLSHLRRGRLDEARKTSVESLINVRQFLPENVVYPSLFVLLKTHATRVCVRGVYDPFL